MEDRLLYDTIEPKQSFGSNLETRRWPILICFSFYNASAALAWLTYDATVSASEAYFGITESQLLAISDSSLYAFAIFSFLGCWLSYKSFRCTLTMCCLLTAIGGWVRYFAGNSYAITLVGQVIAGIAAAPGFGLSMLIPDRWFSASERFFVTSISVYSNSMGWTLGCILPPAIIGGDISMMSTNVLVQAIFMTIPFLIGLFSIKERPKVPPSYSALVKLTDQSSFFEEMRTLMKMPQFLISSLIFGLVLGVSYSVSTVSGIIMKPQKLSPLTQGAINSSYVASGLVAGFIATLWMANKKEINLDRMIKALLTLSLLSLSALGIIFYIVEVPSVVLILICNCVLGIGMIGIVPFICSSITESTFPAQESMSTNVTFTLGMLFGVLNGRLSTIEAVGNNGFIVLAVLFLPCWIYICFIYKTQYKRLNADGNHQVIDADAKRSIAEIDAVDDQEYPIKRAISHEMSRDF